MSEQANAPMQVDIARAPRAAAAVSALTAAMGGGTASEARVARHDHGIRAGYHVQAGVRKSGRNRLRWGRSARRRS